MIMNKTELRNAINAANKIIKLAPEVRENYVGCFYDKQGRQIIISNCLGWQNLTVKANEDKWETSPIYFSSDRGDGIYTEDFYEILFK